MVIKISIFKVLEKFSVTKGSVLKYNVGQKRTENEV